MNHSYSQSHLLGLRTVIYPAPDLTRAKAWYASVLGLEPYFDQPFYVGFNVGGYELGLDPDPAGSTGAAGGIAYWGVSDAQESYQRLLGLGAQERSAPQEVGDGFASRLSLILSETFSE